MPAVARVNDMTSTGHGCTTEIALVVGPFSTNVFANGRAVAFVGSMTDNHTIPNGGCVPHPPQPITSGSSSVFANGIPLARIGDPVDAGEVIEGSPNVFAG
jgi:uncharacterized Zn-binding protein involved in type VI secretion